ncbi:MAG: T9SS type A sorting domain-containing protein [Chitinophagaceae bacterium]|nr:MAG: T9SS type A sorting domain-containing protein [Chitinophagaceae bacterium]
MQEKSTFKKGGLMSATFTLLVALSLFTTANAQTFCPNENVFFTENFGTGTTTASSADVINVLHSPILPNVGLNDGYYRIINNAQQRGDWHDAPDHTPADVNGKMLVVNGIAETFYTKTITNGVTGFNPGTYGSSLFLMNTQILGAYNCGAEQILPTITFLVEYSVSASGNNWIALQSSTANSVPQTLTPVWVSLSGVFNLPVAAQRFRLSLSDGTTAGCGNDFAIDDIKFVGCPEGGPLPVKFLDISAAPKGSGVSVNWSTAAEYNNKYFDVEKSLDGSTWTAINKLNGAGNSNTTSRYSSYDAKPVAGYNYYRVKQVDIDGKFDYSSIVKVKISIEKTGVSVLTNPFVSNITVDFLSNSNQSVNVRLTDVSGKLIATEKWQIGKGNTRLVLDKAASLQRGMYILTVTDSNNETIYNNKLIKQ